MIGGGCPLRYPRFASSRLERPERPERLAQQYALPLAVHGGRAVALRGAALHRREGRCGGRGSRPRSLRRLLRLLRLLRPLRLLRGATAAQRGQRAPQQRPDALARLRLRLRRRAVTRRARAAARRRGGERKRVIGGPVARAPIKRPRLRLFRCLCRLCRRQQLR
eukprot:scaffold44331_cov56-Phaeocystis_antarctica.AAC.1